VTTMQRIMVVDDERNIRKVLSIHLKNERFAVETAASYEEAVDKLSETGWISSSPTCACRGARASTSSSG